MDRTARRQSRRSNARHTMDEMFVADDIAVYRITRPWVNPCASWGISMDLRKGCDPDVFYRSVRSFRGQDNDPRGRKWGFEGVGLGMVEGKMDGSTSEVLEKPEDLSGPSAGQSALMHALHIILGLDDDGVHTPTSTSTLVHSPLRGFSAVCKCTYSGTTTPSYATSPRTHDPSVNSLKEEAISNS